MLSQFELRSTTAFGWPMLCGSKPQSFCECKDPQKAPSFVKSHLISWHQADRFQPCFTHANSNPYRWLFCSSSHLFNSHRTTNVGVKFGSASLRKPQSVKPSRRGHTSASNRNFCECHFGKAPTITGRARHSCRREVKEPQSGEWCFAS